MNCAYTELALSSQKSFWMSWLPNLLNGSRSNQMHELQQIVPSKVTRCLWHMAKHFSEWVRYRLGDRDHDHLGDQTWAPYSEWSDWRCQHVTTQSGSCDLISAVMGPFLGTFPTWESSEAAVVIAEKWSHSAGSGHWLTMKCVNLTTMNWFLTLIVVVIRSAKMVTPSVVPLWCLWQLRMINSQQLQSVHEDRPELLCGIQRCTMVQVVSRSVT